MSAGTSKDASGGILGPCGAIAEAGLTNNMSELSIIALITSIRVISLVIRECGRFSPNPTNRLETGSGCREELYLRKTCAERDGCESLKNKVLVPLQDTECNH